jgi:hypothetical protein
MLIALSRFTFLLEVQAQLDPLYHDAMNGIVNFRDILETSPAARTLDGWVDDLAADQAMIASYAISKAMTVFVQADGAPDGSQPKVFTWFDPDDKSKTPDGSICQFFAGIETTGKKAVDIAEGIDHTLTFSLGLNRLALKVFGLSADSGGGTPESLFDALSQIERADVNGDGDSCGLHDNQSEFRLPIEHFIGPGGLDNRNAIQAEHAVYDLFKVFKELSGSWPKMISVLWTDDNPNTDVPKELMNAIQEPVITRWWTIGKLARFLIKYWTTVRRMAISVINSSKTDQRDNKIASGLVSLMDEPCIHADVAFIAAHAKQYLDKHMLWYQREDPNLREPGFLTFHRCLRYFVKVKQLEDLAANWQQNDAFKEYCHIVSCLPEKYRTLKQEMPGKFFDTTIKQVKKHNRRYANSKRLLRASFAEPETSKYVARILLGRDMVDEQGLIVMDQNEPLLFESDIHGVAINISDWIKFLQLQTASSIEEIRLSDIVQRFRPHLEKIAEGFNIWDRTLPTSAAIRLQVLNTFAAQCSTQHNNERLVKATSFLKATGKSEKKASIMAIASNDFTTSLDDTKTPMVDCNVDETDDTTSKKKKRIRGHRKALQLQQVAMKKLALLGKILAATEMTPEPFGERRKLIYKNLTSKEESLQHKRMDRRLQGLMERRNDIPNNARLRMRGVDIPARLCNKIPLSDLLKKKHEDDLDQEIRHRHLVPYLLGRKRAHPVASPCPATGKSFENMTFTQKKDFLMVDEERLWRLQNPEADIKTFDSKTFTILCDDVRFDFTSDN